MYYPKNSNSCETFLIIDLLSLSRLFITTALGYNILHEATGQLTDALSWPVKLMRRLKWYILFWKEPIVRWKVQAFEFILAWPQNKDTQINLETNHQVSDLMRQLRICGFRNWLAWTPVPIYQSKTFHFNFVVKYIFSHSRWKSFH